jgi:hypothetical protein
VAAAARLADRLIVTNDGDRTFALDRGWQPPERVALVPHGLSEIFLASAPEPDRRVVRALVLRDLGSCQRISYLAAAISRLHAAGHRLPLTVLGPGVPSDVVLAASTQASVRLSPSSSARQKNG